MRRSKIIMACWINSLNRRYYAKDFRRIEGLTVKKP
jgi:hypothetical protein